VVQPVLQDYGAENRYVWLSEAGPGRDLERVAGRRDGEWAYVGQELRRNYMVLVLVGDSVDRP
jgi:hypothetical protein